MNIMFICTGNICRSAMAHWLLKKKLEEQKISDVFVYSCGTNALDNDIPTQEAIEVLEEYGVNLKKHQATSIRKTPINEMDLILCMTNSHTNLVKTIKPELQHKVYTLKPYVGYEKEGEDIKDPWGYTLATYHMCASVINECLDLLIQEIKKKK